MTTDDGLEARLDRIAARYDEPHRHYHNLTHLAAVLSHVDRLLTEIDVRGTEEIRLAALFHDAVYDPRSTTNEADSAALAEQALHDLLPPDAVASVVRLIMATASHVPAALDEAVLLDADLAVLAADAETYSACVDGIRAEYAHVDDAAWRTRRAEVLRSFLDRSRIFHTPPMSGREAAARRNLAQELAHLEP